MKVYEFTVKVEQDVKRVFRIHVKDENIRFYLKAPGDEDVMVLSPRYGWNILREKFGSFEVEAYEYTLDGSLKEPLVLVDVILKESENGSESDL